MTRVIQTISTIANYVGVLKPSQVSTGLKKNENPFSWHADSPHRCLLSLPFSQHAHGCTMKTTLNNIRTPEFASYAGVISDFHVCFLVVCGNREPVNLHWGIYFFYIPGQFLWMTEGWKGLKRAEIETCRTLVLGPTKSSLCWHLNSTYSMSCAAQNLKSVDKEKNIYIYIYII